ncbi:MAG TPA: DUF2147 domain-containing protein [Chryseosolibacter sp.]
MKTLITVLLFVPSLGFSQNITGKWTTIDDETGKEKSVVEVYEKEGKYFGKVTKLFRGPNEDPDPVCDECEDNDPRYKKKIIGMEIIRNMKKDGDEYANGDILDPANGKVYKCRLWLEGSDLKVRGYWGPFFRTQTWKKSQ